MRENTNRDPEYSIVVLCYGSGDLIPEFVDATVNVLLENEIHDYQLILVGNYLENHPDQTPVIVKALARENPRIVSVAKKKAGMMGWDMRTGLAAATGKYISVIDGDGQMPVEDLVKVYRKIQNGGYDLVKTVRTTREDGAWRIIISGIFNILVRLLFPTVRSTDINSKPKIFTRASYERLDLSSDDWFIDAEIMIQAGNLGFRVAELPTYFNAPTRNSGSFINFFTILEFVKNLIRFRTTEFWNK
jgi:glycosyltransferase involved in cell wall biosynthesis